MKKIVFLSILYFSLPVVMSQVITTIAGTGVAGDSGDGGQAILAKIRAAHLTFDTAGNLYLSDAQSKVRMINPSGIITTVVGTGIAGYSGDGGPAVSCQLKVPSGISFRNGRLYIADALNSVIRMVDPSGIISTIAGDGTNGFGGDGGPAVSARLFWPRNVISDDSLNLYITDFQNDRIRKINAQGIITTFAGTGVASFSGDGGPATAAGLCCPHQIAIDPNGNIYFNDGNPRIRKVNTSGIITTVVGGSTQGYSGDGGLATLAQFKTSYGIIFDSVGNMFFSDYWNNNIRKVDTNGIISTIVGAGTAGYSGDGGLALNAELNGPYGLALDATGNLYIADAVNGVIRKVTNVGIMGVKSENHKKDIILYPNPCNEVVYLEIGSLEGKVQISNSIGEIVYSSRVSRLSSVNVKDLNAGIYFVEVRSAEMIKTHKIIVQH